MQLSGSELSPIVICGSSTDDSGGVGSETSRPWGAQTRLESDVAAYLGHMTFIYSYEQEEAVVLKFYPTFLTLVLFLLILKHIVFMKYIDNKCKDFRL
jgi:hypothetical protein